MTKKEWLDPKLRKAYDKARYEKKKKEGLPHHLRLGRFADEYHLYNDFRPRSYCNFYTLQT